MVALEQIPFSAKELEQIRAHFRPDEYDPDSTEKAERNKNRVWAAPVKNVLVPKFQREATRIKERLDRDFEVALVVIGNDPASRSYVTHLEKLLKECNIGTRILDVEEHRGQEGLSGILGEIGRDDRYIGVICQLPLPDGFDEYETRAAIHPDKDIDVLNPGNLIKFMAGKAPLLPATMGGIAMAIQTYGIDLGNGRKGKEIAVLGQGSLVGTPANILFTKVFKRTVLSTNEDTPRISQRLRNCDIIVSGTGQINAYDEKIINPKRKQVLLDIDFEYRETERRFYGGFTPEAHRLAYMSLRNPDGSGRFTQLAATHNVLTLAERAVQERADVQFRLYQQS